mmetsp:Transcript_83405/g.236376  ORF Transcript_83405/g.236376 Transcript_83405/m.236376 type:complete len:290 (-) Transcript_83405:318-1187(-)
MRRQRCHGSMHQHLGPPRWVFSAALCLVALRAAAAFVAAPLGISAEGPCALPQPLPRSASRSAAAGTAAAAGRRGTTSSVSFGCVVLLLASAARRTGTPQRRCAGRRAVVACGVGCWPASRPLAAPLAEKQEPAAPGLVQAGALPALPPRALPQLAAAAQVAHSQASPRAAPEQRGSAEPAGRPQSRAGPALFAGGARHARSPRASHGRQWMASESSRTARRSVGARLQALPERQRPFVASYDASRVRTQLQVGMQTKQQMRSERPREFRVPSTSNGLNDQSGVRIGNR